MQLVCYLHYLVTFGSCSPVILTWHQIDLHYFTFQQVEISTSLVGLQPTVSALVAPENLDVGSEGRLEHLFCRMRFYGDLLCWRQLLSAGTLPWVHIGLLSDLWSLCRGSGGGCSRYRIPNR